jgi:hypothetical protein
MLAAYMTPLGLQDRIAIERGKTSPIPQVLADRTGWESFIDDIDRVNHGLPDSDRQRAVVFVPDYVTLGHSSFGALHVDFHG